jgi:hypothetical protein
LSRRPSVPPFVWFVVRLCVRSGELLDLRHHHLRSSGTRSGGDG